MISPETLPDILERVDEWTEDELQSNINKVLPVLISSLKNVEQKSLSLRSVQALLNRCISCVPVTTLDSDVLQHALPAAKDLFTEALEVISLIARDEEGMNDDEMCETMRSLYHVCCKLLESLSNAVTYVSSRCPLRADQMSRLPCPVLQVLQTAFTHCSESEKLLGSTHEYLVSLFKNCQILLSCLEELLVSGIQFNSATEEDEMLLIGVLDSLAGVAKATTTLGIQVQTCSWRMYLCLVEKHAACRELWHGSDVSSPVEVIASTTTQILYRILEMDVDDMQLVLKVLAVLRFLVRILTRLCNVFAGYLTDTCMPSVLQMLALLKRMSAFCASVDKAKSKVMGEAEKRVGVAVFSLVTSLLSDRSFVMAFFVKMEGELEPEPPLSWLLLATSIAQALVALDADARKPWISNPKDHLLMYVFQLLGMCHADLCGGFCVRGASQPGKAARSADLYEHVLVPVAAFVLLVPVEHFNIVERTLFSNVVEKDPWKALFAMDLWCMVARQGAPSLRASHIKFILQQLKNSSSVPCNPRQAHLRVLLGRLWPLVPHHFQLQLLEKFPPADVPAVWEGVDVGALLEFPPDTLRSAAAAVDTFLSQPASLETFSVMIKNLETVAVMSRASSALDSAQEIVHLASAVVAVWSCVCDALLDSAHGGWVSLFMSALQRVTGALIMVFSNTQLLQIMKKFKIITKSKVHLQKVQILSNLKILAEKVFDSSVDQQELFSILGAVFADILQDENVVVRQNGFEVFEYFAHFTSHEDIVKSCLTSNRIVQGKFAAYLKKVPVEPTGHSKTAQFNEYLKCQESTVLLHKCNKTNEMCYINTFLTKYSQHSSKEKQCQGKDSKAADKNLFETVQRIRKDVEYVQKACKEHHLSDSEKLILCSEINEVNNLINNISIMLND